MNMQRTLLWTCGLLLLAAIVLSMSGCHKVDVTENMFPLAGTWTGRVTEMYIPPSGPSVVRFPTLAITISQNGAALSGTWSIVYSNSADNGGGTISGSARVEEDGYYNVVNQWVHTGWKTQVDVKLTSTTSGYPSLFMPTWNIIKESPNRAAVSYRSCQVPPCIGVATMDGQVLLQKQ